MEYEHIRLTQEAGIVTLSFNRPETRNAMSPAMGDEIVHAVERDPRRPQPYVSSS